MNIRQDICVLFTEYFRVRAIKNDINEFRKKYAKECSISDYRENHIKTLGFRDKVQAAKLDEYGKYGDEALKHRSTSCFYVGPEKQFALQQCVNVQDDGFIIRNCCSNCPHFKTIQEYSVTAKRLSYAQEKQKDIINNYVTSFVCLNRKARIKVLEKIQNLISYFDKEKTK